MILEDAIAELRTHARPARAAELAAYHKLSRPVLGVANAVLNDLGKAWRQQLDLPTRLTLARALWQSDIFEARIMAAKLVTQARLRPDGEVWALITGWAAEFDGKFLTDQVCVAGAKRLVADPARAKDVEVWVGSDHLWHRRAALIITQPWSKQNHPKPDDLAMRERVLGWAADTLAADHRAAVQKALAGWIHDLARHDGPRARAFLDTHGDKMKPHARKEAGRSLR